MGSLATLLASRDVLLDGGLATELEARGHDLRDGLWSARLLRDDPQAIEDVHVAYFEAGADVASRRATTRRSRDSRRRAWEATRAPSSCA
jgi:homocysteine S-methyltransferase